jgi:hypothetical protein
MISIFAQAMDARPEQRRPRDDGDDLPAVSIGDDDDRAATRAFWTRYARDIRACHRCDEQKCVLLTQKLQESVVRLRQTVRAAAPCREPTTCKSTRWTDPHTLVFVPADIMHLLATTSIAEEQWRAFRVMHALDDDRCAMSATTTLTNRITIVMDLRELTCGVVAHLLRHATRHIIVDGARLWQTLPYNVNEVRLIRSRDARVSFMVRALQRLLSQKITHRVQIVDGA